MSERHSAENVTLPDGIKAADITRVAGLIGDQHNGLIGGIRAYYEADIREQVAQEIEAVAASGVHASDEPMFVDAAYVARHGSLNDPRFRPGSTEEADRG